MEKSVGIWIDHDKAIIVTLFNGLTKISYLKAETENNIHDVHSASSATHYGHQEVSSERKIERRHKEHLHHYYQNIIHQITDVEEILIFGPGNAKVELEKEIKKINQLSSKIIIVEPAEKMTDKQAIKKVKEHFNS